MKITPHQLNRWRDEIGDPLLASIVVCAVETNQDLQVSTSRICEVRAQ
ncbi:MAG: hypothetical protein ACWGOX_14920 [Desulforhopalus sp.]